MITHLRMLPSYYQMMMQEERIEDLSSYIYRFGEIPGSLPDETILHSRTHRSRKKPLYSEEPDRHSHPAHCRRGAEFMKELFPQSYQNQYGIQLATTLKQLFTYTTEDAIHVDFDVAHFTVHQLRETLAQSLLLK